MNPYLKILPKEELQDILRSLGLLLEILNKCKLEKYCSPICGTIFGYICYPLYKKKFIGLCDIINFIKYNDTVEYHFHHINYLISKDVKMNTFSGYLFPRDMKSLINRTQWVKDTITKVETVLKNK